MKRLLLTLSLICFSWGAGADPFFGLEDKFRLDKGVPTRDCLEAKKNGIHLKSNYYFYEGFIYELIIKTFGSTLGLKCYLYEKQ